MQHMSKTAEQILPQMNLPFDWQTAVITQFRHEEDGEPYQVWKIQTCKEAYILKEAKGYEAEVYTSLLPHLNSVPQVYQITVIEDTTYLLMEYVEGQDLRRCTRPALTLALDALIQIQQATWNNQALAHIGYSFAESLPHRKKRGTYLQDAQLEAAYDRFLSLYVRLPRTLCHDDLLPFNVLVSPDRAVLIDWEYAGLLPYPTSFARLIAHGEESEDAFFYMTEADRQYAISYYYDRLLRDKGISYEEWLHILDYFLLYEYCEWVMIGHRYGNTDSINYKKYIELAKHHAQKLLTDDNL